MVSSGPDLDWVMEELRKYIKISVPRNMSGNGLITSRSAPAVSDSEMHAARPVIEAILDRFYATWREENPPNKNYKWAQHRNGAIFCLSRLEQRVELEEKLGSVAPRTSADSLHPWVWDAARPQWESRHFGEAVRAAAVNINSRLQSKVNRRDLSDKKSIQETFSESEAAPGRPRLRIVARDDSETYRSQQAGVRDFGAGCFGAIRNPLSHLTADEYDLSEQEAIERLAALSLLARWIDQALLEA